MTPKQIRNADQRLPPRDMEILIGDAKRIRGLSPAAFDVSLTVVALVKEIQKCYAEIDLLKEVANDT